MRTKRILSIILALVLMLSAIPFGGMITSSAKTIEEYSVGDIIEFGSYPQSKVTDTALISSLDSIPKAWTSYGYYSGTGYDDGKMTAKDYMKYADISYGGEKFRAVKFTSYRPYYTGYSSSANNSYQDNNGYYTNNVYYFKYEPLKWRILDPNEGYVMCESIIDSQAFNNYVKYYNSIYYGDASCTHYASDYANSSIRQWLNNDFYNTAFSSSEKSKIVTSQYENKSTYSSTYDSTTTYDKITLLSYYDAINSNYGFSSSSSTYDTARRAKGTDYAKCQGLWVNTGSYYNGNSYWRLRSPNSSYNTRDVSSDGYVFNYYNTIYTYYGIRPAFKFNPKSTISKSSSFHTSSAEAESYDEVKINLSQNEASFNAAAENQYMVYTVKDFSNGLVLDENNLVFVEDVFASKDGICELSYYNSDLATVIVGDFGNGVETRVVYNFYSNDDTVKIDKENKLILNVPEGITSLDGYVETSGYTMSYVETDNGFGTGTKVNLIVESEIVDTYTIVVPYDVTGDGYCDAFDVSVLSSVANFEIEFEENSAYFFAGDVTEDGFIDSFDVSILTAKANYEL